MNQVKIFANGFVFFIQSLRVKTFCMFSTVLFLPHFLGNIRKPEVLRCFLGV